MRPPKKTSHSRVTRTSQSNVSISVTWPTAKINAVLQRVTSDLRGGTCRQQPRHSLVSRKTHTEAYKSSMICLPRRNQSSFWAFCSSRLTFFLNKQSSRPPSQNLENYPETDRDDFNSSIESTISTSLIHNIATDGKSEQIVTWFLNRVFKQKMIVD